MDNPAHNILRTLLDALNSFEDRVLAREQALRFVQNSGLTVGLLESLRRIELQSSDPDFDYVQSMNEMLEILDV